MNKIYDNFGRPDLPRAESRLETETVLGPLNYPTDLARRDQYFREGLMLLREIPNQEKLRTVVASYIKYATDPALRTELETFLQSLSANLARSLGDQ